MFSVSQCIMCSVFFAGLFRLLIFCPRRLNISRLADSGETVESFIVHSLRTGLGYRVEVMAEGVACSSLFCEELGIIWKVVLGIKAICCEGTGFGGFQGMCVRLSLTYFRERKGSEA